MIKEKDQKDIFDSMKSEFGYKSVLSSPRITKIVVSTSFGSSRSQKDKVKLIADRLAKITGQTPSARVAKQSVASFKLREGETIGYAVTLRGSRMRDFLGKFINVTVPRMRDFHGFSKKGIDSMGNYTIGLKEHTIFPEVLDEELKNVFGLAITIVTTAKTKEETERFLGIIGIPFEKEVVV